jgi:biotin carboxyl carrier protein
MEESTPEAVLKYRVELDGHVRNVEVTSGEDGWRVRIDDGAWRLVSGRHINRTMWSLRSDGEGGIVDVALDDDQAFVLGKRSYHLGSVVDPRQDVFSSHGVSDDGVVKTQMPGAVVRVLVHEGDTVAEGQILLVVEAMKMENEFKAPRAGRVDKVHVTAGQTVDSGAKLVEISSDES